MEIQLSDECASEIENLISRISGVCSHLDHLGKRILIHPDQGILVFAVDKGVDTIGSLFTIPIPTNIESAQAMLDGWGDRPISTGGNMTLEMAEMTGDVLKNRDSTCINIGCWLVAFMFHKHCISLEEQILQADHYGYFFTLRDNRFTFSRANLGPRFSEVAS